ncbi:hypothetical protein HU200_000113 [Digitaria exilis]|uniref:Growth-regulating factor n=1 Tax=Digitaria exilis TaxID=1010633 RepID=A0A835FZE5_9POAL|nr:hypothetical protein HU200_000113 [Digitaria exilis]
MIRAPPIALTDTGTNLKTSTSPTHHSAIKLPFPSSLVSVSSLLSPSSVAWCGVKCVREIVRRRKMMLSGHGGGGGRRLFTASQWQELEHQALIYKYMASGAPVPHDLVLPLRVDTAPSLAFPPQTTTPTLGYWGCYGAGATFGRKAEDPEPGRCRRTDGKKWRCSRESHGESKYCEKHIHRGKSRSRKPVETVVTSSATSAISPAAAAYRPSALSISPPRAPDSAPTFTLQHHQHLHHGGASSTRATGHATAAGALQLHLDAAATGLHAASPPPSYHRYAHGHAQYTTPPPSLFSGGYGHGQANEVHEAEMKRRHYLALGADLSLEKTPPAAAAAGGGAATEKPLRRFFDEWPREGGDARPWAAEDATQLSISIPASSTSEFTAGGVFHVSLQAARVNKSEESSVHFVAASLQTPPPLRVTALITLEGWELGLI